MRSVNKVILIGNLTRDPQLKQTANGQSVATFGLATNRTWVTTSNEKKVSTEYHEVVAWSHLAEFASHNLRTGKLVYVEGYLKTRSWDQEDGTKRFKTEIVVQDLIILSKREGGDEIEEFASKEASTDNSFEGDIMDEDDASQPKTSAKRVKDETELESEDNVL
jgi:single-strand DNA-binding protein